MSGRTSITVTRAADGSFDVVVESILGRFDVDVIRRYFPSVDAEIAGYL